MKFTLILIQIPRDNLSALRVNTVFYVMFRMGVWWFIFKDFVKIEEWLILSRQSAVVYVIKKEQKDNDFDIGTTLSLWIY